MYEMKLKSGLVFKSRTGVLSGFVDLGSCNRDIELVGAGDEDVHDEDADKSSLLAKQVKGLSLQLPIIFLLVVIILLSLGSRFHGQSYL